MKGRGRVGDDCHKKRKTMLGSQCKMRCLLELSPKTEFELAMWDSSAGEAEGNSMTQDVLSTARKSRPVFSGRYT